MTDGRAEPGSGDPSESTGRVLHSVPLFPLPNVVLFPRAILPLHIFEERYKAMTADALTADKRIAMALLKPGWEKDYYGRPAIEPVVCVGTIVSHERLADGKYNFLLQGTHRATIVREISTSPSHIAYRRADLQLVIEPPLMEIDLSNERLRLTALLSEDAFNALPLSRQFLQMLSSHLTTADIVDLIAFNLLEDLLLKQRLLAEPDPRRRARHVLAALETMRPATAYSPDKSQHDANLN
jgi:uncharacterized protein